MESMVDTIQKRMDKALQDLLAAPDREEAPEWHPDMVYPTYGSLVHGDKE